MFLFMWRREYFLNDILFGQKKVFKFFGMVKIIKAPAGHTFKL